MSNTVVELQMQDVKQFLSNTVNELSDYLNSHSLDILLDENGSKKEDYYEKLLKSLRRLEVFCSDALDAVSIIVKSEPFRKSAAEQTLYRIYHKCILEFFSPKDDIWYEDSRAAYTGKNSICFHETPPESFQRLLTSLEKEFQQVREELDYYETDYQTKMVMQNNEASSSK
ncbi:hypothetical protein HNQ94_003789 [Salirhabdus euzebyi]|uniref:DUF3907 family protein n=1 Tax=Salirhabdus euzebyi TaxID=394506 RepID=A0A841Q9D3_9BACI|nr:DUF3907 family protein [Salirhabdus euzebyi]MBB6455289.1 hypothetical protein [Salirhabdus euzebyi]